MAVAVVAVVVAVKKQQHKDSNDEENDDCNDDDDDNDANDNNNNQQQPTTTTTTKTTAKDSSGSSGGTAGAGGGGNAPIEIRDLSGTFTLNYDMGSAGYALSLLPSLNDLAEIPDSGQKSLVVVAQVGGALHIRVFDEAGNFTDYPEDALDTTALADLNTYLTDLWAKAQLEDSETAEYTSDRLGYIKFVYDFGRGYNVDKVFDQF